MRSIIRQLRPALGMLLGFTVLCGLIYPLAVTGVAQAAFQDKADGSIVEDAEGNEVGSELIGQSFTEAEYLHPRPSAAGDGYDASASSGSNAGPTNEEYLTEVAARVEAYRDENGLPDDVDVPVDAVTASGSGLDPHISVANAELQAPRVADARDMSVDEVLAVIEDNIEHRDFGFLGESGVNVLEVNLALDAR
jgi:potassium-transporting ATPase KdpC subunit